MGSAGQRGAAKKSVKFVRHGRWKLGEPATEPKEGSLEEGMPEMLKRLLIWHTRHLLKSTYRCCVGYKRSE